MPKEEPDQEYFECIAASYLAEAEVENLTSIHYDTVSLLVTDFKKVLLVTTRTPSTMGGS